jgi:hypothetical protein
MDPDFNYNGEKQLPLYLVGASWMQFKIHGLFFTNPLQYYPTIFV